MVPSRRTHLGVPAGVAVVCAVLLVVQAGRLQNAGAGAELLSHHGGHGMDKPTDVSVKVRSIAGAGYSSSSVPGVEAQALLAQAKATAKKGMRDLEAASAAHLMAARKSALLQEALEKKKRSLTGIDAMEASANASEDHAAKSLLKAKGASKEMASSQDLAKKADLEARADNSDAIATEAESRAAFELAIQDAIDERKSAEGLIKTEKNIAHLQSHVKNLKQRLLGLGTWEPFKGGAHSAHFKSSGSGVGDAGRGGRRSLAQRSASGSRRMSRDSGRAFGSSLGALGDKMVSAHVGEPLIH